MVGCVNAWFSRARFCDCGYAGNGEVVWGKVISVCIGEVRCCEARNGYCGQVNYVVERFGVVCQGQVI